MVYKHIMWYFRPYEYKECVYGRESQYCNQLEFSLKEYCKKDTSGWCGKLTEPTLSEEEVINKWKELEISADKRLNKVVSIELLRSIEDSISVFGSKLAVLSLLAKNTKDFWERVVFSTEDIETRIIDSSDHFHDLLRLPSRLNLFTPSIFARTKDLFADKEIVACIKSPYDCTGIFQKISETVCPDIFDHLLE
jgi:hypothetical protein